MTSWLAVAGYSGSAMLLIAMQVADRFADWNPLIYHSRFRYETECSGTKK